MASILLYPMQLEEPNGSSEAEISCWIGTALINEATGLHQHHILLCFDWSAYWIKH